MTLLLADNKSRAVILAQFYREEIKRRGIRLLIPYDVTKWRWFSMFKKLAKQLDEAGFSYQMYIQAGFKFLYPSSGYKFPMPGAFVMGNMEKHYHQYIADCKASYGRNWFEQITGAEEVDFKALKDSMYSYKMMSRANDTPIVNLNFTGVKTKIILEMLSKNMADISWLALQPEYELPEEIIGKVRKWIESKTPATMRRLREFYLHNLQV